MIGYAQLYFKITGKKNIYYAQFDGDFGKPLTRYRLWCLKNTFKKSYSKHDKIYSVEFVTKEEYERENSGEQYEIRWGDREKNVKS